MHYYKKNIGDYAKKAGRLTMLQHGAYTLLLDACYDREQFPTLDQAIEWTWASNQQEIEAVEFVLKKFFLLEGDKYVQNRIREELENYHNNSVINKRIAMEREAKRREKGTKRIRTVHEAPPNHKPLTNNQEPVTSNQSNTFFDMFWITYPKKTDKVKAQASFKKINPDQQLFNTMLVGLEAQCRSDQWTRENGKFIPNPSTWLNNRRWEDEVSVPEKKNIFAGAV